jgi:hypothetical protein
MRNYAVKYPQDQQAQLRKELIPNGIHASKLMDEEKRYVESLGVTDPRDLPIHLNKPVTYPGNHYYANTRSTRPL